MKGSGENFKYLLIMVFGLLMLSITLGFFFPITEAQKEILITKNAELNAKRIAGIMSILQDADNGYRNYSLPAANCKLEITNSYVEVTVEGKTGKKELVRNPDVEIKNAAVNCKEQDITKLKFYKHKNENNENILETVEVTS